MTNKRKIRFGIIGCGLMGWEFASAASRWLHLLDVNFEPEIIAVCDSNPEMLDWFKKELPTIQETYLDYKELLANPLVEAVYCAVPHHFHEQIYIDIIESRKHLLGEKPFGINLQANKNILKAIEKQPNIVVRCSSEFPFYPGAYQIIDWVKENKFCEIIEVEAGFWHSSDLNPEKQINWKRRIETNGEYGCMGDLGMHVLHLPLRFGWYPKNVRGYLSNIITERPNAKGEMLACDTWDNAILMSEVDTGDQKFPMTLSMKRIAPGHANTWFIRIIGTRFSVEYNTKYPKQIATLEFEPNGKQAWKYTDVPYRSAYKSITGEIFEFGFSDSLLQMWAAYCDEIVNGRNMTQPFHCATPEETLMTHRLFTAALKSNETKETVFVDEKYGGNINVGSKA